MSRRITKDEFLHRCRQHHGDRYDYSCVDYVNTLHKITIADELSDFYTETYRCWLAGETLWDIGWRYGVTAEAVRLRLKRVGELLGTGAVDQSQR